MHNDAIHIWVMSEECLEGNVKASVMDMKYKMSEVLSALDRNETASLRATGIACRGMNISLPQITIYNQLFMRHYTSSFTSSLPRLFVTSVRFW
jgi:hypothetical protein